MEIYAKLKIRWTKYKKKHTKFGVIYKSVHWP